MIHNVLPAIIRPEVDMVNSAILVGENTDE